MKLAMAAAALIFTSSIAFASSEVQSVVKNFERDEDVVCTSAGTSKYSLCLNYMCRYEVYYNCVNGAKERTLTMKVKAIRIPGEAPEIQVLETSVQHGLHGL